VPAGFDGTKSSCIGYCAEAQNPYKSKPVWARFVSVTNPQLSPNFYAVIPAGGVGSRLWPISWPEHPKFLHDLTDAGSSLLQQTFERLAEFLPTNRILVVTGEAHGAAVAAQLPNLQGSRLLLEPSPKDSTAAIALAAAVLVRENANAVIGSFAADHLIGAQSAFAAAVDEAVAVAETGLVVTIGITPTHASTAFGYIQAGSALAGFETARAVSAFVEKPDAKRASEFLATGEYFWNAGMFVVRASVLLDLLRETEPELVKTVEQLAEVWHSDARAEALSTLWPALPKVAIDYSLAEPAAARGLVAVVPATFAWRDLGDWAAVSEELGEPERLTVIGSAEVAAIDSTGFVLSTQNRPISVVGLEDVVVIDTEHGLLVTTKASAQGVKAASEHFSKANADHKQAE
jgi:mannose-1-phosphate guanylyltransferase